MIGLFSIAAGLVLAGSILCNGPAPRRDSGIFLYTAQVILDGGIPYKDAWDNKPPGIFYADALGLLLGRGSIAGVWLVEFVLLCLSVCLGVATLARAFGVRGAFFGSGTWLVGLMVLTVNQGTNLTEEYTIPLKFAAFWLFLKCEEKGYRGWMGLALGATGGMAFLFKQNLVGVHLAITIYLLMTRVNQRRIKALLIEWAWVLLGGVAVIVPVFAYFAAHSALDDLIDAAFFYNMLYSSAPIQKRILTVIEGFDSLALSGVGITAIASWGAGVVVLAGNGSMGRDARRLLLLAMIAFPLELLLVSASLRGYGHYYEAWLPVIAILAAFATSYFFARETTERRSSMLSGAATLLGTLLLAMAMMPVYSMIAKMLPSARSVSVIERTAAYARENTGSGDYVLVWGADPSINFLSDRRSPSAYMHQLPLFTRGYATPAMIGGFLAQIEAHPPALIVDTSAMNDQIPPIDRARRAQAAWTRWGPNEFYASSPAASALLDYLDESYARVDRLVFASGAVDVYQRRSAWQR